MRPLRRAGFAALGALNAAWGAWAIAAPAHFFGTFPGFGRRWTGAYPPYNEHLVSDLGATFLMIGVLLAGVAIADRPAATWVVVAGVVGFNALHLWFHLRHRGDLAVGDYWQSIATLVAGVLLPVALASTHRPSTHLDSAHRRRFGRAANRPDS